MNAFKKLIAALTKNRPAYLHPAQTDEEKQQQTAAAISVPPSS